MSIDTDRLVALANELKTLDQRRQQVLAELGRLAQRVGDEAPVTAHRRGRPPGSVARLGPGRPPASKNSSNGTAPVPGGKRRSGVTAQIVAFLRKGGGAYTAGEILAGMKLPKSKGLATTISTTLVRLAKEGRAKKAQRGYRAA